MGDAARILDDFDALYRRIAALPEGVTGEIPEPGVLETMSRPGKAHRRAAAWLAGALDGINATLGGTGWWIEAEPEIRFGARLFVPDLAGWRVGRVPSLPDENPIDVTPDWCCEILSSTTARRDRLKKLPRYIEGGVTHVWLVDPAAHSIEVYANRDGLPTLVATAEETDLATLPPFDLPMALAGWWLPVAP